MQPVLSLYASGRKTGIVFESGADISQIVPIHEGIAIKNGITNLDIGGFDLTIYLMKILKQKGFSFKQLLNVILFEILKKNYVMFHWIMIWK